MNEFLANVCQEIKYHPIHQQISKELQVHIEEVKEDYVSVGLEEEAAERKAIEQMGDPEEIR